MKPAKSKKKQTFVPEIPYEDHRQTKEIIRMQLQRITMGIQIEVPIGEMHHMLIETEREVIKLNDPSITKAFQAFTHEILSNYPLKTTTSWDHLEHLGRILAYLDKKTIY